MTDEHDTMSQDSGSKNEILTNTPPPPETVAASFVNLSHLHEILTDPKRLDKVLDFIANGGYLQDLCKIQGLKYSEVKHWIDSDSDRKKAYNSACLDRNEYQEGLIMREIHRIAGFNMKDMYHMDGEKVGRLKDPSEWSDSIGAVVKGIEVLEYFEGRGEDREQVGVIKKISFWDKSKALVDAGKQIGMFRDKVELEAGESLLDITQKMIAERRAALAAPRGDGEE